MLHEPDLDTRLVSPELTESEPVSDSVSALETVRRLKGFGIEFSIEHSGAVSSSLMDLKRLSIGELKMDKSFAVRQDLGLRAHSARTGTNPPTRRG
ncbi:MAG: EAL domain-containing protein [Gammaproteobacteria bacterium]|nr:EAL domain-containing protein [Gammaproteobacteria bacterium]